MKSLSIVVPVYGCKTMLTELYLRAKSTVEPLFSSFELILVYDCSPDGAWSAIQELAVRDKRVKGLALSRNFGQHNAITAGLSYASGDWVVVMDCDLQDQPEEIAKMYAKAQEGYDAVLGRRHERQDRFFKKIFSQIFYRTLGYLTGTKQDSTIANFGLYHKDVIHAILKMGDSMRYFPTMVRWVGFRQTAIDIEHAERSVGASSYNLKRLLNLALNVVLSFSDKPLRLTVKLGMAISLGGFIAAFYLILRYFFFGGITQLGWTSLILTTTIIGGITILVLGIVGLYIGKMFDTVKQRPTYIVREVLNGDIKP